MYLFRSDWTQVDTSAAGSSSEGLMWLRLLQSARDRDEQNLEAYIKNGQLFYRSTRRIEKDEELLVWYGKDLIELLQLGSGSGRNLKSKGRNGSLETGLDYYRPIQLVALMVSLDGIFADWNVLVIQK